MSDQPSLYDTSEDSPIATESVDVSTEKESETTTEAVTPELKELGNNKTKKPVFRTVTAWEKYYDDMGLVRQKIIAELAKQNVYDIALSADYENGKLVKPDEIKTYTRKKVSTRDFFEHEKLRGIMQNSKEKDPIKIRDGLIELYKRLATDYLYDKSTGESMSESDFWRCDWAYIKAILDACNLHSVLGSVPLDQKTSGV